MAWPENVKEEKDKSVKKKKKNKVDKRENALKNIGGGRTNLKKDDAKVGKRVEWNE